jgi:hypothetical protein
MFHVNLKLKIKKSLRRPGQALRIPGGWAPEFQDNRLVKVVKVFSLTHRPPLPQEIFLVPTSVRNTVEHVSCRFVLFTNIIVCIKYQISVPFTVFIITQYTLTSAQCMSDAGRQMPSPLLWAAFSCSAYQTGNMRAVCFELRRIIATSLDPPCVQPIYLHKMSLR